MHFHILPRKFKGDRFSSNNDNIYPAIESAESEIPSDLKAVEVGDNSIPSLKMDDEDRPPRTIEEMVKEADWLKGFFGVGPGVPLED